VRLVSLHAIKVNKPVIFGEKYPKSSKSSQSIKFRFAPSPNGLLHLGHAYSALLANEFAKKFNGIFQLRIEDIDEERSKKQFVAAIYRDLHWLGLSWPTPVRQQSDHMQDYKEALDTLKNLELLYPCFATRRDIKTHWSAHPKPIRDPDGALLYPGIYKNYPKAKAQAKIKQGHPFAWRLHMDRAITLAKQRARGDLSYLCFDDNANSLQKAINPQFWGDVIIARKDVSTSYHLSVVMDDHSEAITHICRGKDLEAATDVHRILQIVLGLQAPLYHHHELVTVKGEKLSKSQAHPSLYEARQKGLTAKSIKSACEKGVNEVIKLLPLK